MRPILREARLAGVLVLSLATRPLGGQLRVDAFTTSDGLPQNTVSSIAQTRDGHLWLGTYDGLVRFDGIRFTVFDRGNTPALRSTQFLTLFEDAHGTLWGGTVDGGLLRYRDGRFASFTRREGMAEDYVGRIQESSSGLLVFYGEGGAVGLWRGAAPTRPASQAALRTYTGPSGTRWERHPDGVTATGARGELRYPLQIPLDEFARFRWESPSGDLWIGSHRSGVHRLARGAVLRYGKAEGVPAGQRVRVAGADAGGRVWLYGDDVVLRQEGERFVPVELGRAGRQIRAALVDRQGIVWVGTNAGGLLRVAPEMITSHAWAPGGDPLSTSGVLAEPDGSVRVATGRGAALVRGGQFSPVGGASPVRTFYRDRDGALWTGGSGVLRREIRGREEDHSSLVGEATVNVLLRDRAGTLWIGTNRGLLRLAGGRARHLTVADGLPGRIVAALLEEGGRLWVGTSGGLARLEGARLMAYRGEGPLGGRVRALHQDPSGALWVGTFDRGLARLQDGRVAAFTTRNGLPSNGAFAVVEDERANLWISSNRGIYRVARAELEAAARGERSRVHAVGFGVADGMRTVECNGGFQPAAARTPDGRIWFPTQEGVVALDPALAELPGPPPVPVVQAVSVEGRTLEAGSAVILSPGQRSLQIDFTAPSFHKAEYVRFRYRLRGRDADWIAAGMRRSVQYSSLPPGEYTFELQAAGAGGPWSARTALLDFLVEPRFWQTGWFAGLVLILVGGAGAGVSLLRVRRLRAAERRLARLVEERTAALAVANARLEALAASDALTGLANRRHFNEFLEREWRAAARAGGPVALLMLDVDHFKRFNDCYGHPEGDACLRRVSSVVQQAVRRPGDLPARYGGEEFAVVMGGTDAEGAGAVAEEIRTSVASLGIPHVASPSAPHVTVSVGVAVLIPGPEVEPAELVAAADVALYRAKERGRDRVEIAEPIGVAS